MRVLKIVAEGLTTSFRYPHFIQSVHPSFPMPPPSTIYGHIASALGNWFDPEGVQFAIHFTYDAKQRDIEHTIMLSSSSGKLKGTKIPKVLEGKVNPFYRELFFFPRLTLYINQIDWLPAFQSPRYPVLLGRSQDLFTYTQVKIIDVESATEAYFEKTLLPYSTNRHTSRGYAILMPRLLDNERMRHPSFSRYFVIEERISSREFLWFGKKPAEGHYWVDPDTPEVKGEHRGLSFLSFVGEDDETFVLA
ncbi:MAG: type I-B CRISPR-associated protein Cas5 [Anaerolineales bacterium]|nr:type I-B CRISPR-associated protein Cas5 [Anaerolineales bacterium]